MKPMLIARGTKRFKLKYDQLLSSLAFNLKLRRYRRAVGESVAAPMRYYSNNIVGTVVLVEVMEKHNCRSIIFSSSATVYGEPAVTPCTEESPTSALNPYGRTKLFIEHILTDLEAAGAASPAAGPAWQVVLLRYFNPVGAHPSGRIGEDPKGTPNNLMPFVQQVAVGRRPLLSVYGDDYPTTVRPHRC